MMKKWISVTLLTVLLAVLLSLAGFSLGAASVDDLAYAISNDEVIITNCDTTASGDLVIPDTINGYPVTSIGNQEFYDALLYSSENWENDAL